MTKNRDLIIFTADVKKVLPLIGHPFTLTLNENLEVIERKVKNLEKVRYKSKEYLVYEKEVNKLYEKYSEKDPEGNALLETLTNLAGNPVQRFKIDVTKTVELVAALRKIETENQKLVDIQAKKQAAYVEGLDDDAGIKLEKIDKGDIPKDISGEQLHILFKIGMINPKKIKK